MVYENGGNTFLVISSVLIAIWQDGSIFEFRDVDFVADEAAVAASIDSEGMLREAHHELTTCGENNFHELIYMQC